MQNTAVFIYLFIYYSVTHKTYTIKSAYMYRTVLCPVTICSM